MTLWILVGGLMYLCVCVRHYQSLFILVRVKWKKCLLLFRFLLIARQWVKENFGLNCNQCQIKPSLVKVTDVKAQFFSRVISLILKGQLMLLGEVKGHGERKKGNAISAKLTLARMTSLCLPNVYTLSLSLSPIGQWKKTRDERTRERSKAFWQAGRMKSHEESLQLNLLHSLTKSSLD